MRKFALIVLGAMLLVTISCKKNSTTTDPTAADLQATEGLLNQDYNKSQQEENLLSARINTPGVTWADQTVRMYDSIYHRNDTLFTENFRHYSLDMMTMAGMKSNGMMNGSMMGGGMMCNMDSLFMVMGGMQHMNTFKIDSMMMNQIADCPKMGTMPQTMQNMMNAMQGLRKQHMMLHNLGK
jgi:hypothetical protein